MCSTGTKDFWTTENGSLQQSHFNEVRVNKFDAFLYHIYIYIYIYIYICVCVCVCIVKTSLIDSP